MRVTPGLDTLGSFEICNPPDPDLIQTDPAVAFDDENYVVVWSDEKNVNPSAYRTTVARVSPEGAVLDTGVFVSPHSGAVEYRPDLACDSSRSLVVWTRSSVGIYGRFVRRDGVPEGSVVNLASGQGGGARVAFDGTNYLVTWFSGTYPALELYARLVAPDGTLIGSTIPIALGPDCHRWADVVFDGTCYLVVWQTGENNLPTTLHAQFVSTSGELVGSRFTVCGSDPLRRWWPAVATSDSNVIVVWEQGSPADIWANVDVAVTGCAEPAGPRRSAGQRLPTVGTAAGLADLTQRAPFFDALGREVRPDQLKPGVYFCPSRNPRARLLLVR